MNINLSFTYHRPLPTVDPRELGLANLKRFRFRPWPRVVESIHKEDNTGCTTSMHDLAMQYAHNIGTVFIS